MNTVQWTAPSAGFIFAQFTAFVCFPHSQAFPTTQNTAFSVKRFSVEQTACIALPPHTLNRLKVGRFYLLLSTQTTAAVPTWSLGDTPGPNCWRCLLPKSLICPNSQTIKQEKYQAHTFPCCVVENKQRHNTFLWIIVIDTRSFMYCTYRHPYIDVMFLYIESAELKYKIEVFPICLFQGNVGIRVEGLFGFLKKETSVLSSTFSQCYQVQYWLTLPTKSLSYIPTPTPQWEMDRPMNIAFLGVGF